MKHTMQFTLVLALAFFQSLLPVRAIDPNDQPRMRAAIAHLEAAKLAPEPLPSLRAAKKQLQEAKPNKEGERKDALRLVNEAIAFATAGNKKTMQAKIDDAIGNIKSGIARSR